MQWSQDMEVWQIALYGGAAFLAVRTITSLAANHKRRCLWEIHEREEQRRREELAQQKAEQERAAKAKGRKPSRVNGTTG
jgi:hypothetical protein